MNPKHFLLPLALLVFSTTDAQSNKLIVAGPLLGHVELRTATIWVQFAAQVKSAVVLFRPQRSSQSPRSIKINLEGKEFNSTRFLLTGLEPGTTYEYSIRSVSTGPVLAEGKLTTQMLWQWRTPAPDFSFITGSCAYFNEPQYDRPGKPYGEDSSIFTTMSKENADFMLWLGDNWYTRESDFFSEWGLYSRASRDRSLPVLQPLLKKMPQYAIWDDHDYGPDNADVSYVLKNSSRKVFMDYWANPSYGANGQGIYSKFSWNGVDFFLLDDRWFRADDKMPDSINGQPNPSKKMFGDEQMHWLKNALLLSAGDANTGFRMIITGSQVLNPFAPGDCLRHYPVEYNELISFIADNKINGVVFVTGDRHHSEIIKGITPNCYPLFDITVSPLTSAVSATRGAERNNPARISKETDTQNYGRFSFTGSGQDRKMQVEIIGTDGSKLDEWGITLKEISCK
jgi:alkaline phosphatase D